MYLKKDGTAFTDQEGWQTLPFTEEVKDRDPRLAQSIRTPGYKRIGAKRVQGPDLGVTITGYQPIKFVQDTTASGGQIDRNDRSTCDMPVSAMPKCCSTMPKPRPNWERSRRTIWLSPSTKSEAGWECGAST